MDILLKRKDSSETIIIEDEPYTIDDIRILTQVDLGEVLGISTSTIRKLRKEPDFPPQKDFGSGVKGWVYEDVKSWVRSRQPVVDARGIQDSKPEIVRDANFGAADAKDATS